MTATSTTHRPRTAIPEETFHRLSTRLAAENPDFTDLYIGRIIDQTLAFLDACARTPDTPLTPSKPVDLGWHTFLLHTVDYTDFCQRAAGRFLHHVPTSPDDETSADPNATVTAMRALGLPVDNDLWATALTGDCTQCHAGCFDSPKAS
ncbi:hypothetical protein BBK14_27540 [Parafrankia soli]|uniref:Uncharacterized protein n=1 Tax=Parafrankia soli TaxID=2599596 RepID=A0A1S1PLT2_9ACTN|nr:hypothetical protein [Parafrankia soli]OHV20904.1 hypothetical protein BBK14_27540 [Parafrankia soli]